MYSKHITLLSEIRLKITPNKEPAKSSSISRCPLRILIVTSTFYRRRNSCDRHQNLKDHRCAHLNVGKRVKLTET